MTSLPWVPFRGPLELLASAPGPDATIGSLVPGLARGVVDLAHLVHVHERVEGAQVEGAADREALALEPARRRLDALPWGD
jgi:hypothetical protein